MAGGKRGSKIELLSTPGAACDDEDTLNGICCGRDAANVGVAASVQAMTTSVAHSGEK